jgi:alanine racemase
VEIDLGAVAHNFKVLKSHLPAATRMMAAVKANAYGHGILEVSERLAASGVDYLGVACVDEAFFLRCHRIKTPILHLGAYLKGDVEFLVRHDITATVTDLSLARGLNEAARRLKKKAKVHVKIDTGMGRLGVWHGEADDFVLKVCGLPHVTVEGLYTHFPSADSDEAFTRSQITVFCSLVDRLRLKGVEIPFKHLANSVAVLGFEDAHFNLVRPGLALYGLYPREDLKKRVALKPVMSFKTKIAYLKTLEKGRSVSYGRTYVARRRTRVATLPVGYGDGYNRLLSNRGQVLVRGRLCPVVGVVCMDQTMVDVGAVPQARVEDTVVLIGSSKGRAIRVEEIARLCGTIPYEVVCWISPRVRRVYLC